MRIEPKLPLHPPEPGEESSGGDYPLLMRSTQLRFPSLNETHPREKVAALEQHICATAAMRGELAELRMEAHTRLYVALDQWDDMQVGGDTGPKREDAKRRARPALWKEIKLCRWLVERCTEEMARMDQDYQSASRAYTLIAGS